MTMTEKHGVDNDAENITLLRQVPCVTITVDAFQVQLTSNRSSVMRPWLFQILQSTQTDRAEKFSNFLSELKYSI